MQVSGIYKDISVNYSEEIAPVIRSLIKGLHFHIFFICVYKVIPKSIAGIKACFCDSNLMK